MADIFPLSQRFICWIMNAKPKLLYILLLSLTQECEQFHWTTMELSLISFLGMLLVAE